MESKDDWGLFWLHLICCGAPLIIIVLITFLPLLLTFVLTYKVWLFVTGFGVALAALLWWRRRREEHRPGSSSGQFDRMEPALRQWHNPD